MNCTSCNSDRILSISAKCSDLFSMNYKGDCRQGYVPEMLFFGKDQYGDYVSMNFCLDCGKIQSKFPISENMISNAMGTLEP
jgi:hypothetical protein